MGTKRGLAKSNLGLGQRASVCSSKELQLSTSLLLGNRPGNTSCPDAPSRHQAVAGFQLCGSNSPMRLAGCVGNRSRMSSR